MPVADDLRTAAKELDAEASTLLSAGNRTLALRLLRLATVLTSAADELDVDKRSADVQDRTVTQEQFQRRGFAVAAAKAHNAMLQAIGADPKFKSLRKYVRIRKRQLGCSLSSLSGYMNGSAPCPKRVADVVAADFPKLRWTWPAGITD